MPEHSPANQTSASDLLTHFLKNVRRSVPLAIEQIDTVLRLIGAARQRVDSFLNICCGDAVLASAILAEHPQAHAIILELVPGPGESARLNLQDFTGRVTYVQADIAYPNWIESLPHGARFDAIISSFALQPLSDARKQTFYRELWRLLRPEGVFLNIEYVASATRWSESVWDDTMITALFGEIIKNNPHKTRAEIAREYYEKARTEAARCAPFEVQLDWLRSVGFTNVDCYLKVLELALFGGQRPAEVGSE